MSIRFFVSKEIAMDYQDFKITTIQLDSLHVESYPEKYDSKNLPKFKCVAASTTVMLEENRFAVQYKYECRLYCDDDATFGTIVSCMTMIVDRENIIKVDRESLSEAIKTFGHNAVFAYFAIKVADLTAFMGHPQLKIVHVAPCENIRYTET